ncbi:hypothetical protein EON82_06035 [bacterium]|nr:MAG: hypothetical protein EON82_06035 [bacterium]
MIRTTLGSGWEFVQTDLEGEKLGYCKTEWLPADVPGHIHLDLMANGIIPDPFVGMQEYGVQWVDEKDWSYRTTFEWSPKEGAPRRILRFNGLDTVCSVKLNGEEIATHDNMFTALEVDVTDLLQPTNELRIDFRSALKVGAERMEQYYAANGLEAPIDRFDERSFVRKAQYMYGWDWGPRLISCGIWQSVELLEFAARLKDVHIVRTPDGEGGWDLTITSEVEGDGVALHTMLDWEGDPFLVPDGVSSIEAVAEWTPEDSEESKLELVTVVVSREVADRLQNIIADADEEAGEDGADWAVETTLLDDDPTANGAAEMIAAVLGEEAEVLDFVITRCDVGTVRLLRETDEYGESFEFELNGRKIWARGANWIPDDNFPARITRTKLRKQLERCKDMGFNMLRVWGGGLYETDDFYELCDELGILVWQDFPFACAYYPDGPDEQEIVRSEAAENIKRIRNHPCLALWCGNNENHEMYYNGWAPPERTPPRYFGINLYEDTLPDVVDKLDEGRSYIPSSPIGSPPDEKVVDAKRRGPNADHYGDQHNWDVWHGRGDWKYYTDSKGRFSSEYGFTSSCGLPAWKAAGVQPSDPFRSPVARWHDKTLKGYETFIGYVELHYPPSVTIEDWTYYSQLNQRDALRHGIEHYRRSPFCRGSLVWQVNDCWPVQSWAMLDSLGHYKALAYESRRLYAEHGIQIVKTDETIDLFVFNDGEETVTDVAVLRAYHLTTGEVLQEWTEEVEVAAGDRRQVLTANVGALPAPDVIVVAEWAGDKTWRLLSEPKSARFAPPAEIVVSTAGDGHLTIKTTAPVVDLWLTVDGSVAPLAGNFLTLPQPGVYEVDVNEEVTKLEARSLAGRHPVRFTRSAL